SPVWGPRRPQAAAKQTTHPTAINRTARATDRPASMASPFPRTSSRSGKDRGGKMEPPRAGVRVRSARRGRPHHQSEPSTLPSWGLQAFSQVVTLTPDPTLRTLPSPSPTLITAVDRAWTRYGSQLVLVDPN